jgi:tRNA uridine 5-carbamoylmethylation protein Kti12
MTIVTTLTILRGLPGAGKTTKARELVNANPSTTLRLNRDDYRTMLHGGLLNTDWQEHMVTVAQHAAIRAALNAGYNVVVDDTNLPNDVFAALVLLGANAGAVITSIDLRDVPLDVCINNNMRRAGTPGYVPPEVIRAQHATYIAGRV